MESIYRIDVMNAFQTLLDRLSDLKAALYEDRTLMAWTADTTWGEFVAARDRAFEVIMQLSYQDGQDPRSILLCPGFIGASQETLEVVQALNNAKLDFKRSILALKHNDRQLLKDRAFNDAFESLLTHRDQHTQSTLRKMGLSRLHLKQCYRLLPILPGVPKKLSWTWANTRAIKRISVAEAAERLSRRADDPNIALQLQRLNTLNPKEPLAIVQELAPHLRVNTLITEPDGSTRRLMVKGPVPLFFLADQGTPPPVFTPPSEKKGRQNGRPVRADVKLDPEPFLPAIRAHRYLVES